MTQMEKFDYWQFYAERDLDAAQAMLETGRWFYVLFMCQQSMEKLIKGFYGLYIDEFVPKTHNIEMLANRIENSSDISFSEDMYELFRSLSKYYLADRYPDFSNGINTSANKHEAESIFRKTKEVFAWLLTTKLSKN
ncbi:MAG: HEPN domain-containing protein [Defluviitaleaceae bacterium]|nr:HEPN domain-containing protein [Defluviitaleaceae bacterium]